VAVVVATDTQGTEKNRVVKVKHLNIGADSIIYSDCFIRCMSFIMSSTLLTSRWARAAFATASECLRAASAFSLPEEPA
jgi:hypothetical protein